MYNLKKYLTATLAGLMALGTTPLIAAPAGSDSTEILSYSSEYYIIEYLSDIDFGRDIEFFSLEQNSRNGMRSNSRGVELQNKELLEFEMIEQFEEFIFLFIEAMSSEIKIDELKPFYNDYSYISITPFNARRNDTASWWAPFEPWGLTGVFTWKNIGFSYAPTTPNRTSPTVTGSWTTGIQIAISWTHRSGSAFAAPGNNIHLQANGTWTVGGSVAGVPIGATWNDTWSTIDRG
ncbi:MAG: hypothetical protein FWE02_05475 [Defluviitaleaceae bacterium]|nr:hypothetical protein [Defluviitaleaceae bacterium]